MGAAVKHNVKVRFNTEQFHKLVGRTSHKSGNLKEFHSELKKDYGLGLAYSSWINVLNNRRDSLDTSVIWMIADKLGVNLETLIDIERFTDNGSDSTPI